MKVFNSWIKQKVSPNHKHADIVSACLALRDDLPIDIVSYHVHGHQDKLVPMHRLSPESRTNIQMDENATKFAERLILLLKD